MDMGSIMQVAY